MEEFTIASVENFKPDQLDQNLRTALLEDMQNFDFKSITSDTAGPILPTVEFDFSEPPVTEPPPAGQIETPSRANSNGPVPEIQPAAPRSQSDVPFSRPRDSDGQGLPPQARHR
ncbi:MAG: hypothetical protein KC777_14910 [Cyanobacteria bacterium HKST-UBA02]|nr:hypothetical protein [Cyanobacteria bacterium HKST-UBA02]